MPPSKDPKEYAKWLRELSAIERHQIALFCRANKLNYEPSCGGIGPLHVPRPPALIPRAKREAVDPDEPPRAASREAWLAGLTMQQRQWVTSTCDQNYNEGELCTVMTPLVVSIDNRPVELTSGGSFPFAGGQPIATDWPTAATPWIALDLDGDGAIGSGAELFGSYTVLPDGTAAHDGFAALAALDANHDGRIDQADPLFASLVLWADRDGSHRSTRDELTPLASVIVSISLDAWMDLRCDARRNCEGQRASLVWRDAEGEHTGSVVDIYLPFR
ncbi:MAG: hemolysin-type calcium binding protein [Myxococcales bacterium]|nr:hemolysin-type calcium binding protein [Myxococcales bacterium]